MSKPLSTNINILSKELRKLQSFEQLGLLRKKFFALKERLNLLKRDLPSGSILDKQTKSFFNKVRLKRKIKEPFAAEQEVSNLKKLINQGDSLESRIKKFGKGSLVFNKTKRLNQLVDEIINI